MVFIARVQRWIQAWAQRVWAQRAWAQRAWAQRAYPPILKGHIAVNSLQDLTSSSSSYSPATGGAFIHATSMEKSILYSDVIFRLSSQEPLVYKPLFTNPCIHPWSASMYCLRSRPTWDDKRHQCN